MHGPDRGPQGDPQNCIIGGWADLNMFLIKCGLKSDMFQKTPNFKVKVRYKIQFLMLRFSVEWLFKGSARKRYEMDLREKQVVGWEVGGNGSGSCPMELPGFFPPKTVVTQ